MTKAETLFCSSLFVFSFVIIIDVKKGCWKTFKQLIPLQRNTLVVTLYIRRYALLVTMLHCSFHLRSMYILWFYCRFSLERSTIKMSQKPKKRREEKNHTQITRHGINVEYLIQVYFMDAGAAFFIFYCDFSCCCSHSF